MLVKIRFGRGPVVTRRAGKNSGIARLSSSLLAMASVSCASLGLWRVGTDLDVAGKFVIEDGLFSHWQVWIGGAIAAQYASWRLSRYAKNAAAEAAAEADNEHPTPAAGIRAPVNT